MQQIRLRLHDNTLRFQAGQYLEIVHPDGTGIPLSVASSPLQLPELAFHYQSVAGSDDARRIDELLKLKQPLQLDGPGGDVFITAEQTDPLLLVAGGTGASQALSIIEDLLLRQSDLPVTLICFADHARDFYFREHLEAHKADWLRVEYFADPGRTSENRGMMWLRQHASQHMTARTIICGGPPFVYAALDALTAGGMPASRTESDVYAYAPRH